MAEVAYEWDDRKAAANIAKHGVDFADAVLALEDALGLTMPDTSAATERRFVTLGQDALGRLLVVVYTVSAERVRLISARQATRSERRRYEEAT